MLSKASFETGVGFSFDNALALSKTCYFMVLANSIVFDSSTSSLLHLLVVKDALWSGILQSHLSEVDRYLADNPLYYLKLVQLVKSLKQVKALQKVLA